MFRVAEACAGLRFLIAAIAFGVVYACTIYRSTGRRVAFIAASLVVPVVANGFRALGIVELGHLLGSAQAGVVDHILYGWIFFSIVILLLILAGLPFRQDAAPLRPARPRNPAPPAPPARLLIAGAAILLLAAVAPAVSGLLDLQAARQQRALPVGSDGAVLARLATPAGCVRLATDRFDCAGVRLAVRVKVFAPRSSPATLIAAQRAPTAAIDLDTATVEDWTAPHGRPAAWEITETGAGGPLIAVALATAAVGADGVGAAMRVRQALASILGGAAAPVLLTVTVEQSRLPPAAASAVLRAFLDQQTGLLPAAAP
jgi:exosortase/archaeosortase family protein